MYKWVCFPCCVGRQRKRWCEG